MLVSDALSTDSSASGFFNAEKVGRLLWHVVALSNTSPALGRLFVLTSPTSRSQRVRHFVIQATYIVLTAYTLLTDSFPPPGLNFVVQHCGCLLLKRFEALEL
jgi:hypothetical protein